MNSLVDLQRDGIIKSSIQFNAGDVVAYLLETGVHNAHVAAKGTEVKSFQEAHATKCWPMFCHAMEDIVLAPHILEIAIRLLPLAREYFGEPPLLYSMNAFWTQSAPGHPQYLDTHEWHRDTDDRKQMVAFFMLTDVTEIDEGAHQYQSGTHLLSDAQLGWPSHAPPPESVVTIFGAAGDVFIEDTRGLHQAHRPRIGARGLAWARFGVSDPPESYVWDKLSPIPKAALGVRYPTDQTVQQAIRLVVA